MDGIISDPVMYCLNYRNCRGDCRRYYVAEREVVEDIKRKVDKLSDGRHEAVFPAHSEARVVHNPAWEESLEFIARTKDDAISCAEEMGFKGLFIKSNGQS